MWNTTSTICCKLKLFAPWKKSDLRVKPYRKCNHRCNFHLSTLFWFETEIVYQQQNAHTRIFKYAQSPTFFLFALGSLRRVRVGAAGSTKDCTNNTLLFTRKKFVHWKKKNPTGYLHFHVWFKTWPFLVGQHEGMRKDMRLLSNKLMSTSSRQIQNIHLCSKL